MPLSKRKQAGWMRVYRQRQRVADGLGVSGVMSSADVRAKRRAGLKPEDIENETGTISSRLYYALLRDRDSIKAHLSWHHDMVGKPDVGTFIEQLQTRVTQLEADMVVHEAQERGYYYAEAERILDEGKR